jgi:hypothetical protein
MELNVKPGHKDVEEVDSRRGIRELLARGRDRSYKRVRGVFLHLESRYTLGNQRGCRLRCVGGGRGIRRGGNSWNGS